MINWVLGVGWVFVGMGKECEGHFCIFRSAVLWTYKLLKVSSTLKALNSWIHGNKSQISYVAKINRKFENTPVFFTLYVLREAECTLYQMCSLNLSSVICEHYDLWIRRTMTYDLNFPFLGNPICNLYPVYLHSNFMWDQMT